MQGLPRTLHEVGNSCLCELVSGLPHTACMQMIYYTIGAKNTKGPKGDKECISSKMSHHVKISPGVSALPLVGLSMGLYGHSPWCSTDIFYAAEVSYWLTSRVSKTLKCLPDNMRLNKLSKWLLCTTLCVYSLDPWTCWWICKILCERNQLKVRWTLIYFLSASQNNDISSISWHHCMSLTRKALGVLEKSWMHSLVWHLEVLTSHI